MDNALKKKKVLWILVVGIVIGLSISYSIYHIKAVEYEEKFQGALSAFNRLKMGKSVNIEGDIAKFKKNFEEAHKYKQNMPAPKLIFYMLIGFICGITPAVIIYFFISKKKFTL